MKTAKKIAMVTIAMLAATPAFADVTFNGVLQQFETVLSGGATLVFNVLSIILGLVAAAFAVMNFFKFAKGGGQDSDNSLLRIAGGLLIVAVLLQVIKFFALG